MAQAPAQAVSRLSQAADMLSKGRPDQAKLLLQQVVSKEPGNQQALRMLRQALTRLGAFEPSLYYAQRALKLAPNDPDALNLVGNSLCDLNRLDEAEQTFRRALEIKPGHATNIAALCNVLAQAGKYVDCVELASTAIKHGLNNPGILGITCSALAHLGEADQALLLFKQAAASDPQNVSLLSVLCGTMNYAPSATPSEMFAAHCAFGRLLNAQMPYQAKPPTGDLNPDRPLRVGLVSGDFRNHASAFFTEPLLDNFDQSAFQIYLYQNLAIEDDVSERLKRKPGVHWFVSAGLNPKGLAQRFMDDKLDVLIDVSGHTGGNALGAMQLRAVPVQVLWQGYPCTSGVANVDYRIVDSFTDPAGFEKLSTEKLWRIDPCVCCYRPPTDLPEITGRLGGPAPGWTDEGVVFGTFSAAAKLNDPTLRRWISALRAVPGSTILVKNQTLKDEGCREHLIRRFELNGLSPDRVRVAPPTKGLVEHLAMYNQMDIALDTFPYPGITTVCESLVMGVPIITMVGQTSASRSSVPMLKAVGLDDLIAENDEQFVNIATKLAADGPRRTELRSTLRETLKSSAICDEQAWTARFTGALREMWKLHCAKSGPRA